MSGVFSCECDDWGCHLCETASLAGCCGNYIATKSDLPCHFFRMTPDRLHRPTPTRDIRLRTEQRMADRVKGHRRWPDRAWGRGLRTAPGSDTRQSAEVTRGFAFRAFIDGSSRWPSPGLPAIDTRVWEVEGKPTCSSPSGSVMHERPVRASAAQPVLDAATARVPCDAGSHADDCPGSAPCLRPGRISRS